MMLAITAVAPVLYFKGLVPAISVVSPLTFAAYEALLPGRTRT